MSYTKEEKKELAMLRRRLRSIWWQTFKMKVRLVERDLTLLFGRALKWVLGG